MLLAVPLSVKTFLSLGATPILTHPEELGVDLLRLYQVFQLLEARKRPVFKDLFCHVNPLEQIIKLFCSASCVPGASEPGQMLANLVEGRESPFPRGYPLDGEWPSTPVRRAWRQPGAAIPPAQ
jgi:hypothetical protein